MFENIENIKLISSSNKEHTKRTVKSRRGHVLILRTSGCGIHNFGRKTLKSLPGSILFIPAGFSYSFEPLEDVPCRSISITFFADITNPRPALFDGSRFPNLSNVFLSMCKYFHLHSPYSKYMCLSLLYSVLAYLAKEENMPYHYKKKDAIIEPALKYITEHLYDPSLKTDTLHTLCGISAAYFRRIFKANTGTTPQKYIEERRLEYALTLVNEKTALISEIAQNAGYNDPLYFGSVFKKKYGSSPSQMRRLVDE